jgi:molybdopterin/thiamine biosynthesis adenylyltransferase
MAKIFQVGVGSGGMVVLDLISRDSRIDHLVIVDPDLFQPHNVVRHLFPVSAVSRLKVEVAAEWVRDRRPDITMESLPFDLTDPAQQHAIEHAAASADVGICAADNETAKYHFDRLMRRFGKPWTLGEVLSGGIGGWVHRFVPGGPCYGCLASHLQRYDPPDPHAAPPDYSQPGGTIPGTTIPASRASIDVIAGFHALATLALLDVVTGVADAEASAASWLFALRAVPGIFEQPFKTHRITVPKLPRCLICSAESALTGENLDVALAEALDRLGHE